MFALCLHPLLHELGRIVYARAAAWLVGGVALHRLWLRPPPAQSSAWRARDTQLIIPDESTTPDLVELAQRLADGTNARAAAERLAEELED
jgi:hypothetical protein